MSVFYFSHTQSIALVAVHHHWYFGVICESGIVSRISILYVYYLFFVCGLSDRRKVAVAFVDGIVFDWDGRVDIFIELLYI
jgi:hypothetical protein